MNSSTKTNAFWLSVLLHASIAGLLLFLACVMTPKPKPEPKIFELVAGGGDNYGATEAPALGSPSAVNFTPLPLPPTPEPAPQPDPTPVQADPTPVAPAETVQPTPRPTPKPATRPVNLARLVTRIADKRAANIQKKLDAQRKLEAERAAREAQKKMTLAEFQKLHGKNTPAPRINARGIAAGVLGGSVANDKAGAGGKALTAPQQALSDAYVRLLMQRLAQAHQKPSGLSDLLQATVTFHLNADGTMSNVRITESSGNAAFDASVIAAFRRVQLPPPPTNLDTEDYDVTFKMKDDE